MFELLGWLAVRIMYAWILLYSLKPLLADWEGTKQMLAALFPFINSRFSAIFTLVFMFSCAMMILFGFYAQVAGILLSAFTFSGYFAHMGAVKALEGFSLSPNASASDKEVLSTVQKIGAAGHVTSANKNLVLAAMGFMFFMLGSGPLSLTPNLF